MQSQYTQKINVIARNGNSGVLSGISLNTASCSCDDPTGQCVMVAVQNLHSPPERWSSCSRYQLRSALSRSNNNLGRCLQNEPTTTVGEPVCGNGIRERDEVCDCGRVLVSGNTWASNELQNFSFTKECNDPCCDARTCRMAAGAQCMRGECCTSTCQFKPAGTSCRSSSRECDIEEHCSGGSSECPADVYLQDGTPCSNNQSYCFSGECKSYDKQCQYHFQSSETITV